jgi:hypothetical protein
VATVAEEVWLFGEDALYEQALTISDDEMLRLWKLAGRLLWHELAGTNGEAAARAAITILEGADRPLARRRRRPRRGAPELRPGVVVQRPRALAFALTSDERFAEVQQIQDTASSRDCETRRSWSVWGRRQRGAECSRSRGQTDRSGERTLAHPGVPSRLARHSLADKRSSVSYPSERFPRHHRP